MNRTRTIAATAVLGATLALGAVALPSAQATPEPATIAPPAVTASEWACLAVGGVDLGLCLDNPVPDTSGLPTVPEILGDVLGILG
ncbi:hypothetical protein [Actinospongicola halichondriae]|uniref:hypothetical protein n=1 Tax=Actinospongicola halichondriae TaxID=3236844 RepID=UPI003D3CBCC3